MTGQDQIRPGYKQTEVGVIPEDWEALTIGEVAVFSGGTQPPRSTFRFSPFRDYIRLVQIRDYKSASYPTFIPLQLARKFCAADDIMIGRYGPPIFQILRGISGAYNVALIKVLPSPSIDREFLYYTLKQDNLFELIDSLSRRSSGQTGIEMPALRGFPVPLPPLPEQRAIAEALSDADGLIAALEALIAKKRDLKQAAMQQLLTGKTRLPGFSGEWEVKHFSELFNFLPTATNPRADLGKDGQANYIHYGDVHTRFEHEINISSCELPKISLAKCRNAAFARSGDVIMVDASEDYDGVGKSVELIGIDPDTIVISGLHTYLLREKRQTFSPHFKGYLLNAPRAREQYQRVKTGMKVFGVSKGALLGLNLPVPPLNEQTAIAEILRDMDADLAALEGQRDKAKEIKQGMMQELLTGKVRLI